jgi:hypothetical protein
MHPGHKKREGQISGNIQPPSDAVDQDAAAIEFHSNF